MRAVLGSRRGKDAQTFVFFALTFGTIFLLCGLAIDSGLLFLAKARMGRSVDGATLAAVGNFNNAGTKTNPTPDEIRDNVANIMRNFAVANYTDLGFSHTHYGFKDGPITASITGGGTSSQYTTTTGATAYNYTYNFNDGTKDPNGQYRKFVQVILTTGVGGQITSATCNARCPVGTFFIGVLAPFFRDLKVSASSVATRNPRLIAIVVDRSGSMLLDGGGAYGLPQAIVQFLDFFDTSSDYITIVSFGSSARVEMALTTNFLIAGTNVLFDTYQTNSAGSSKPYGIPAIDPENSNVPVQSLDYDPFYVSSGIRRMKFGGTTAADEGIRLGMEQLMANSGFNDPDVVKYMVLFTDGAWNESRTLLAAPPYTNTVIGPPLNGRPGFNGITETLTLVRTNTVAEAAAVINGPGWVTNVADNTNLYMLPTFCEATTVTNLLNSITANNQALNGNFTQLVPYHTNDIWQSMDDDPSGLVTSYEPLTPTTAATGGGQHLEGMPTNIVTYDQLGLSNGAPVYARYIDVWLQPGAVDYELHNNNVSAVHVSDLVNPTQHLSIELQNGDSNMLVVPGYVADGLFFDNLDMAYEDNSYNGNPADLTYPRYRLNNYQEYFMWPDDTTVVKTTAQADAYRTSNSLERQLMFRNYPNLLTGFYITRPDEPDGPAGDTDPFTGATRASYGLGAYYPAAGFYWPFDLVGLDSSRNYGLTNANIDLDPYYSQGGSTQNGGSRHESYSINMLSAAAAPRWSGEWFYEGTGGNTNYSSPNNVALSTLMTSKAQWQAGAPWWVTADFDNSDEQIMTNEAAHNTNIIPTAQVWRPTTFSGTLLGVTNSVTTPLSLINQNNLAGKNYTGGYVIDSTSGKMYANPMAWSGRPTHYFDFSTSKWIPIVSNHQTGIQALPLGLWKAQEYAWHARAMGVTIYTVGFGNLVTPSQQLTLAQIANATNNTAGIDADFPDGTGNLFNPAQPIGQQFFTTNPDDITKDFSAIGQAINAADAIAGGTGLLLRPRFTVG